MSPDAAVPTAFMHSPHAHPPHHMRSAGAASMALYIFMSLLMMMLLMAPHMQLHT